MREFLGFLAEIARALDERDLFDTNEVLLTAGGSVFFDLAVSELTAARLRRPARVVLRSGCYLTEDWGAYGRALTDVHARTGSAEPALEPAIEVWAQVLSVPEPGLVILSAGRRDFGQDAGNPVALEHVRRGSAQRRPLTTPAGGWPPSATSTRTWPSRRTTARRSATSWHWARRTRARPSTSGALCTWSTTTTPLPRWSARSSYRPFFRFALRSLSPSAVGHFREQVQKAAHITGNSRRPLS